MLTKKTNEAMNNAHADTIHHSAYCQQCTEATHVARMCPEGQRLASISRQAMAEHEAACATH
jgi:hypothetical protein